MLHSSKENTVRRDDDAAGLAALFQKSNTQHSRSSHKPLIVGQSGSLGCCRRVIANAA